MTKLTNIKGLEAVVGVPVRTLRSLKDQRKIPFIKTGHRTVLFDPEKVRAALLKFEVRAVA
jgi:hypothetical protein